TGARTGRTPTLSRQMSGSGIAETRTAIRPSRAMERLHAGELRMMRPMSSRVLVVDEEETLRLVLETLLRRHGYTVKAVSSAEAALAAIEAFAPDFVLADVRMGGMSGIELTRELAARGSSVTVIVMSAYGSIELALEAMKAGAYDYVAKPFKQDEVLLALRKAEERESLRRENKALKEQVAAAARFEQMIGK